MPSVSGYSFLLSISTNQRELIHMVLMPSVSSYSFLQPQSTQGYVFQPVLMPSVSGYSFLLNDTKIEEIIDKCVNAQCLGLFISTEMRREPLTRERLGVNAQCLGLFISTKYDNY